MMAHHTPAVEKNDSTVICWTSQSEGFVFDIDDTYVEPTLVYSHAVVDGERKDKRPPRAVVRTLRNDHDYKLR